MKKLQRFFLILAFSIIILVVLQSKALACDTIETATLTSTCVVMDFNNVKGVWFQLEEANNLRVAKLLVPELKLQIEKQEKIEENRVLEIQYLNRALDLQKKSTSELQNNVNTYAKMARESHEEAVHLRESLSAWYRSPWLWGAMGIAIGAVTTSLITLQLSK